MPSADFRTTTTSNKWKTRNEQHGAQKAWKDIENHRVYTPQPPAIRSISPPLKKFVHNNTTPTTTITTTTTTSSTEESVRTSTSLFDLPTAPQRAIPPSMPTPRAERERALSGVGFYCGQEIPVSILKPSFSPAASFQRRRLFTEESEGGPLPKRTASSAVPSTTDDAGEYALDSETRRTPQQVTFLMRSSELSLSFQNYELPHTHSKRSDVESAGVQREDEDDVVILEEPLDKERSSKPSHKGARHRHEHVHNMHADIVTKHGMGFDGRPKQQPQPQPQEHTAVHSNQHHSHREHHKIRYYDPTSDDSTSSSGEEEVTPAESAGAAAAVAAVSMGVLQKFPVLGLCDPSDDVTAVGGGYTEESDDHYDLVFLSRHLAEMPCAYTSPHNRPSLPSSSFPSLTPSSLPFGMPERTLVVATTTSTKQTDITHSVDDSRVTDYGRYEVENTHFDSTLLQKNAYAPPLRPTARKISDSTETNGLSSLFSGTQSLVPSPTAAARKKASECASATAAATSSRYALSRESGVSLPPLASPPGGSPRVERKRSVVIDEVHVVRPRTPTTVLATPTTTAYPDAPILLFVRDDKGGVHKDDEAEEDDSVETSDAEFDSTFDEGKGKRQQKVDEKKEPKPVPAPTALRPPRPIPKPLQSGIMEQEPSAFDFYLEHFVQAVNPSESDENVNNNNNTTKKRKDVPEQEHAGSSKGLEFQHILEDIQNEFWDSPTKYHHPNAPAEMPSPPIVDMTLPYEEGEAEMERASMSNATNDRARNVIYVAPLLPQSPEEASNRSSRNTTPRYDIGSHSTTASSTPVMVFVEKPDRWFLEPKKTRCGGGDTSTNAMTSCFPSERTNMEK